MGRVYEFAQAADGVPVYGGVLAIHFNRDGCVVGLGNNSVPSGILPTDRQRNQNDTAKSRLHGHAVREDHSLLARSFFSLALRTKAAYSSTIASKAFVTISIILCLCP